jgi:hypothetical protein
VAARRPTVTTALSELAKHGLVDSLASGWLLTGPPPGELLALHALPSPFAAASRADAYGQDATAHAHIRG